MMHRPRASADLELWRQAMRDVRPLRPHPAPRPPPPPIPSPPSISRSATLLPPSAIPPPGRHETAPAATAERPPRLDIWHFAGIDRANAERLKRGRHPVEGRLDLHGMTQAEAHRALRAFIIGMRHAGKRCVLIVTGRSGVLRSAVPRWLAEADLRPHLLAIAAAQPRDGGSGALYVMLRRTRMV